MSESARASIPISVYLSPKAKSVLDLYILNSGFGSLSRTVEEMILSYHQSYQAILSSLSQGADPIIQNPRAALTLLLVILSNYQLNNGTLLERLVLNKLKNQTLGLIGEIK